MLRAITFAACTLVFTSGTASAIACLPVTIAGSVGIAADRSESFVIGLGQLARSGPDVDGPAGGDDSVRYHFPARFTGHTASSDGFVTERRFDVTVEVKCVAASCGSESLSNRALYFFRIDGGGRYALEADLCNLFFFDNPTEQQLTEVIGLMR
jgi:hypothetical protein